MRPIKPFLNSLRFKLFATILLVIVPLITVLIINSYYSVRVVRNQVAQSNKNMLSLYMNQIDSYLEEVDKYLFNLAEGDTDLLELESSRLTNENSYMLAKLRLFTKLSEDVNAYPHIDMLFIYSQANDELLAVQNFKGNSNTDAELAKQEMRKMIGALTEPMDYSQWHVWKGESSPSLFHLIRTGDVFVGAWVNSRKLIVPLSLIDLGESGAALLTTDKLEPLSHAEFLSENGIDLRFPKESYAITGKDNSYLVMGEPSRQGEFNLIALVPDSTILEQLPYLQRITSVIVLLAGLFLLLFLFLMRRVFLLPVKRLIIAMRRLQGGNWDSRLEQKPSSTEFEIMDETFNRMIGEIHDLKINVYEEQLNHQRAELKHLQLQINPHFFLNTLNIIYNLATVKDFALIQEMSKCLVVYFRFMFRSNSYFVSLKDELLHTANYLRIQQLRFPGILTFRVEAPEDIRHTEVPPLIIQTMVENTIKHAVNMDDPIEIRVDAALQEDGDGGHIIILVRDTGPGFPQKVLEKLQAGEEGMSEEGEHVGIWNARRRLHLLYQDKARIEFYNEPGSGAAVRIAIPQ